MGEVRDNEPDSRARRQPRHAKPPFVGVGGKVEERVDEAQDPWVLIREEAERLREEPMSGFIYLRGALYEEHRWCTRLRDFGKDGQDVRELREIPGARQPQTAQERSQENSAHQQLLVWRTVANAGLLIVFGEWMLARVAAHYSKRPLPELHEWVPGPPGFSTKLFDRLNLVWTEARAEVLGYLVEQYPKDPGAKQALYLLSWLLRTRLKLSGNVGTQLRSGLAVRAGDASYPAMQAQLLNDLPGELRSALGDLGPSKGVRGLRNLVSRRIAQEAKDKTPYERQQAEITDREALLKRGRDAKLPPQEFELYKLLIGKPGLKNKEYGAQLGISANHVGVLKSRIKKTLFA